MRLFDDIKTAIDQSLPEILALRCTPTQKSDGSYVTEGDILLQKLVVEELREHFPESTLVSEESNLPDLSSNLPEDIFVLDPIDGTENFTSGLPEWGISLAYFKNGKHHASFLGCPEMNLWLRSGQTSPQLKSRIRGLSSSLSIEDLCAATQGYEYRILGCCVYNMMCVIRGSFYSFENPKGANAWDIAAGLNLALERNLNVTVNGELYAGDYLSADRKYRFKIEQR